MRIRTHSNTISARDPGRPRVQAIWARLGPEALRHATAAKATFLADAEATAWLGGESGANGGANGDANGDGLPAAALPDPSEPASMKLRLPLAEKMGGAAEKHEPWPHAVYMDAWLFEGSSGHEAGRAARA